MRSLDKSSIATINSSKAKFESLKKIYCEFHFGFIVQCRKLIPLKVCTSFHVLIFVPRSSNVRHATFPFLSFLDVVDILSKNPVTIRWGTNKVTDNLKIPFYGVPYILLAKRRYQRHQGGNIHKKSKENYKVKKKERQTSGHCFIRSRKLSQF